MTAKDSSPPYAEIREKLLRRSLLGPLRGTLAWWCFSLVVFVTLFPPEQKIHLDRVIAIMAASSVVVYVGYTTSSKRRAQEIDFAPSPPPNKLLIAASACLMIFAGFALGDALGFTYASVTGSIGDLGSAYNNRTELQAKQTGSTWTVLVSALFFLFPFAVPLSIMHWSALSYWLRALVLGGVVSYGGYFLAGGTMKGFGDLTILLVIGLVARASRSSMTQRERRSRRLRRRWFIAQVAAIGGFMLLVATALASRLDGRRASLPIFRQDGVMGGVLGRHWAAGVDAMTAYFANGYRGLGMSTDFSPPYDIYGGFRGISDLLSRYLGFDDAYAHSLPLVAERTTGYSATVNWWTVFPWLASDLGWVGAVLFVGAVGALAGRLWVDIIYRQDPLCVGLFYFVLTFLLFVPANNQVFIDSGSTIASLVLLLAYFIRGIVRTGNRPKRSKTLDNELSKSDEALLSGHP